MINDTFVTAIAALQAASNEIEPRLHEHEALGLLASTVVHQIHPDKLPAPAPLHVTTLAGVVAYVRENRDALELGRLSVLVKSPDEVHVVGNLLGYNQQRFAYLTAKPEGLATFGFGQYHELERAVIALRSQFTSEGDRDYLVGVLGNVVTDASINREDDGFSQSVATKQGIRLVGTQTLRPTVELAPYRTFTEVGQPPSQFLARLDYKSASVKVAFFEADGGAWRREAIARVSYWLREALAEVDDTAAVPVIA